MLMRFATNGKAGAGDSVGTTRSTGTKLNYMYMCTRVVLIFIIFIFKPLVLRGM